VDGVDSTTADVTRILRAWRDGDATAPDRLMPLVYAELRRLARDYLRRERPGHTLQPTALVHEAYLRLVRQSDVDWQSRAHFFGIAARMMRRILIDHARAHLADKRGGGPRPLSLDETIHTPADRAAELVALDDALERLAELDPRKGRVVELRFFGGLTAAEAAAFLEVSEKTVKRDWQIARLWLHRELNREGDST
jgi:RNA polymerase sigma factor (TIGR02999 family)